MKNCSCTLASLKEQSTPAKQREVTSTGSRDQPLVVVGRTRANVSLMQTGAADDEGMAPMDVVENIDSSTRALSSGPQGPHFGPIFRRCLPFCFVDVSLSSFSQELRSWQSPEARQS